MQKCWEPIGQAFPLSFVGMDDFMPDGPCASVIGWGLCIALAGRECV